MSENKRLEAQTQESDEARLSSEEKLFIRTFYADYKKMTGNSLAEAASSMMKDTEKSKEKVTESEDMAGECDDDEGGEGD